MTSSMAYPLAVVPIFVNAGTALAPAIVAGAASVVALLLKPREMVSLCRRRPAIPLGVVVAIFAVWWGVNWVMGAGGAGGRARGDTTPKRDWAKVAMDIIRRERNGPLMLRLLWDYNPEGAMVLSSPLVVGNRVYCASSLQNVDGKIHGAMFCLDAGTGQSVWVTDAIDGKAMKPFFSSPAITADGKYVLIGQGLHDDKDCELLCMEAATGQVHWRVKTTLHIESSPAILGDMVVVGAGAIEGPDHKPTTDAGEVIAVRISDGKELWRYVVNDPESSPAVSAEGIVYIGSGFEGKAVVALRSESDEDLKKKGLGRLMWRTALPYPVTGAVTLAGELVVVGGGNSDYVYSSPNPAGVVAALNARSGAVRWQKPMKDAVLGAVAWGDGKLICPVRNGEVIGLKAADGTEIWRRAVSGKSPILAGPAFTGRYVYAVSRDGYLGVLDASDGKLLERHGLNDEGNPGEAGLSLSSPTVAGGRVYVGSETGGLRCFVSGKVGQ